MHFWLSIRVLEGFHILLRHRPLMIRTLKMMVGILDIVWGVLRLNFNC